METYFYNGTNSEEFFDVDKWGSSVGKYIKNPEYIQVTTDKDDKILAGRNPDGTAFENIGFSTPEIVTEDVHAENVFTENISINDSTICNINDIENRIEIKTNSEEKIISYRSDDGMLHENSGITVPLLIADKIQSPSLDSVELTKETDTIYAERPKFGEIWFDGVLPTDISDERTPTWLTMTFKNSGVVQFKCNCTLAIQGHGSAGYAKKGYTLEPYNDNKKSISIKFGDMIAIDSFHLKAYATDSLHCRDMANFNIWRSIIESLGYPYSKFNNIPFEFTDIYNKNIINVADAKYAPDGFPCVCYLNGNFLGLYTLKLKKSRQNYAMEKSIKSEIFLDATNINGTSSLSTPFIHEGWDLKNPKLKNYEEGGEIPDANVLASIERLFNYTSSWNSSDPTTIENYQDYIVLPHWLAFVIFEELVFSEDSVKNNINVVTWDNQHWSVIPYDTDLSYGLHAWTYTLYGPESMDHFVQHGDVWPTFRKLFSSELKQLWTRLRNEGIITYEKIYGSYIKQMSAIPRDVYSKDYDEWGSIWRNGIPSVSQLSANIKSRIDWLDEQWFINNE